MTDFVKKKIVEKLAKFTKDLKPSDISLGVLTGKGVLINLELNCDFITEALQLPPWIRVARVMCDRIRAYVPFTNLRNDPIQISIGTVEIEVTTATGETAQKSSVNILDKLGSNSPSKYGFTEKVIDGMKVEIRSIVVNFRDPAYRARLEISDIVIQSTNPEWNPATLPHTRYKTTDEESVIIYKMCNIGNIKLEGWIVDDEVGKEGEGAGGRGEEEKVIDEGSEGGSGGESKTEDAKVKLRLIAGETNIRFTLKRRIEDCSVLHSRVVVRLGDVMWVLSRSQLQAVSRLVQTLMTAAVLTAQRQREEREALLGDDSGSVSGESLASEEGWSSVAGDDRQTRKKSSSPKNSRKKSESKSEKRRGKSKGLSQKEREMKQKMYEYRSGLANMPAYDVIQNSVHVQTGNIDLQFCEDSAEEDDERENDGRPQSQRSTVESSLLVRLKEVQVDVYLDQPAGSGKHHWNKANDLILRNVRWSEALIKKASKTQHMDLPSVSLQYLHERGVVVRCADFTIDSLCNSSSVATETQLPLITSDKKTFNIPDDVHNPAFQMGLTLYFYPEQYGTKFLIPRPNAYVHLTPVHATLHQTSLVWIMDFLHGVLATVNLDLAYSVHTEGKAFMEELKSRSVPTHQLPGIDLNFKILFSKVTIPLPHPYTDGRPRALQLETASINIQNHSLDALLQDRDFKEALEGVDNGWVFATQGSGEFPHFQGDFPCVPPWLREMLNYKLRDSRLGVVAEVPTSPHRRPVSPIVVQNSELMYTESWHIHTACVHLSFTKTDRHEDTLRPRDFVDDFPLHLWLFLPREKRRETPTVGAKISTPAVSVGTATPHGGTTEASETRRPNSLGVPPGDRNMNPSSSPLQKPPRDADERPMMSFIAHVSSPVRAELERLQFLFLLRLKDSFNELKTSAMRFLSLLNPADEQESPLVTSPLTPRHAQSLGNRHDTLTNNEECVMSDQPVSNLFEEQVSREKTGSASIAGCVIVRNLQIDILLPSIFTTEKTPPPKAPESCRATPTTPPVLSSVSPEPAPPPVLSPLTTPPRLSSPHPPLPPSSLTLPHTGSRSSLLCQTSSTSQTSFQQQLLPQQVHARTMSETRLTSLHSEQRSLSGSQTSLPVLYESGGQRSSGYHGDEFGRHDNEEMGEFVMVHSVTGERKEQVVDTRLELGLEVGLELGQELEEIPFHSSPHAATASHGEADRETQFETGLEEEREEGGRVRLPSGDQREMIDTLTPLTETLSPRKPFPLRRGSTTSSLQSTTSSVRREKPPPLLRSEPQHILRINVRGVSVLPNIQSNEIAIRASFGRVRLCEILANDSIELKKLPDESNEGMWDGAPMIRARIEIGSQVERFNLPPSQETGKVEEVVAMLSIQGLQAGLLAKNVAVVKDFFDDEFEADTPVPIQIHLENSTFELREDLQHTADSDGTMNVKIKSIDIHRGQQIRGTNLFRQSACEETELNEAVLSPGMEDTLRLNSGQLSGMRDTSPAAQSTASSTNSATANSDLLETFRSFVLVFESHVRRHGGLKVQLNQPEHIAGLLQELQVSLSDEEIESGKTNEAPPTYSETLKQGENFVTGPQSTQPHLPPLSTSQQHHPQRRESMDSPTAKSRTNELRKLFHDSQQLARVQGENEDLISQLTQTKILLAERSQDLDEVTSECKKAKDELVTHKQVLENYQEHIERLLTENADLKMIAMSLQSHS
jgi:hypothetical protein